MIDKYIKPYASHTQVEVRREHAGRQKRTGRYGEKMEDMSMVKKYDILQRIFQC